MSVGTRFSARPDRPWDPPNLLYNGCRVFPEGKVRPERGAHPLPPFNAEVKERVELYLYSPYGASWSMKSVKPTTFVNIMNSEAYLCQIFVMLRVLICDRSAFTGLRFKN